jgi:hypothetical protein
MQRAYLFIVTAVLEVGTGLALVVLPAISLELLLAAKSPSPEALFISRVAGAALVAIGVASWLGRNDLHSPAQFGLLVGMLVYNVAVGALLTYAGMVLNWTGIALWPGVAIHSTLAVWCVACLSRKRGSE